MECAVGICPFTLAFFGVAGVSIFRACVGSCLAKLRASFCVSSMGRPCCKTGNLSDNEALASVFRWFFVSPTFSIVSTCGGVLDLSFAAIVSDNVRFEVAFFFTGDRSLC